MNWKLATFSVPMAAGLMSLIAGCPGIDGDPCAGVTCPDGETCDEGECVPEDPCADVTCGDGETCDDGECVPDDRCADVTCEDGFACDADTGECVPEGGATAKTYVGSDKCGQCHPTHLANFLNSGHSYKLNKVENGQVPTYPDFVPGIEGALELISDDDEPVAGDPPVEDPNTGNTDNSLGTPQSYDDVSYVIGGYGWKARWIDADGYIVTGSNVQFNLDGGGMVAYHNNETDKVYNCGNCHTTGWRAYTSEEGDDRNLNRQDDLPGMQGTFAFAGVHCEACHGAGLAHVESLSKDDITREATARTTAQFLADDMAFGAPVACSDCHTRHGEKDYPSYEGGSGMILAKGGLIRHHEQYDELIGINPDDEAGGPTGPHASRACTDCHDPHTTTRYMDTSGDPPGVRTACTDCHAADTYEITSGGMTDLGCIDCHMPRLAKSAVGHAAIGSGPATGDIRTHIFRIDLSASSQFTEDGAFAYPSITAEFACKTCHNGVTVQLDFDAEQLSGMSIHK